jgi:hypothetical protein
VADDPVGAFQVPPGVGVEYGAIVGLLEGQVVSLEAVLAITFGKVNRLT